jgi:hypothetical protein
MSSNLITPVFVASFVHLNKPQAAAPDAPEKYSLAVVLRQDNKEHMAFLDILRKECNKVAKENFGGKIPKKLRLPFRDGDEEDRPEWEGCITFNASASVDYRPGMVDKELQPIIDPGELYSGMHCRVSLRPYAWSHQTGGKGVSLGLGNVQKIADGESLGGGGVKPETEFDAWDDDADNPF